MTRFCPVAPGDNLSKMLESMIGSWSWSAPTRIVIESGEEEEESSGGMLDEGEELPSESPESLICAKHAGYTWVSEKKEEFIKDCLWTRMSCVRHISDHDSTYQ